jgi:tetratricopeptide (TPR) repeat protein
VYFTKCLAIRLNTFDENNESNVELADSYQKLGNNYDHLGNHRKALEFKQKSLAIRLKIFGENHIDVA